MKNIIAIGIMVISAVANAQVIIGDDVGTTMDKTSVLLEFSKKENKGIILPYVRTLPTKPVEGTLLLDVSNETVAGVKYYNGSWVDLSNGNTADVSSQLGTQPNNITEKQDTKVIIGADTTTVDGVLVLESSNKVMVLPTVKTTDDVVSSSPGMMVYLSEDKMFAVYNGAKWSFWAAKS